jgi:hypothetical protein
VEFLRRCFGRVTPLNQLTRELHAEILHPLLGSLLKFEEEESLQLPR